MKNYGMIINMLESFAIKNRSEYFKSLAYKKAITSLVNNFSLTAPFNESFEHQSLINIGESINRKMIEYVNSSHISFYEKYGLEVDTNNLKLSLKRGLIEDMDAVVFFNLKSADLWKDVLETHIIPVVEASGYAISIAGSLRRGNLWVKDIDLVSNINYNEFSKIVHMINVESKSLNIKINNLGQSMVRLTIAYCDSNGLSDSINCDLRIVEKEYFESALLYLTGPANFNIYTRSLAKTKGWKLSEYGLETDNGMVLTEKDIIKQLGLSETLIDPINREYCS
jgi:DNA polymerase/3'-5' exonuclease PolX